MSAISWRTFLQLLLTAIHFLPLFLQSGFTDLESAVEAPPWAASCAAAAITWAFSATADAGVCFFRAFNMEQELGMPE